MKCILYICEIYKEIGSVYIKTTYFMDIIEQQNNVKLQVLVRQKKFYWCKEVLQGFCLNWRLKYVLNIGCCQDPVPITLDVKTWGLWNILRKLI